jgi:hypothetical protein
MFEIITNNWLRVVVNIHCVKIENLSSSHKRLIDLYGF